MTWWRRLGGPDAVSWPLFWVTFAASTLAQFALPPLPIPFWVRVVSLTVAQIAMFVPLMLIHRYLVRHPERTQPLLVIAGYVLATVIRAVALTVMLDWLDGQHEVGVPRRLAGSFASTMLIFIVTSLVVSTSREQARAQARLRQMRNELVSTQQMLTEQINQHTQDSVDLTKSRLFAELDAVTSAAGHRSAIDSLRHLANEVVRPMSHELALSVPTWRPPPQAESTARVQWHTVFGLLTARAPFLPLATAAIMTFFMAAAAVVYMAGSALSIVLATALGTWFGLFAANIALARILPLRTVRPGLVAIAIAACVAGALPSIIVAVLVRSHVIDANSVMVGEAGNVVGATLALCGMAFVGGLAVLMAVVWSINAARRRTIAELAESTERLKVELVRLHQTEWYQQRALARALHGRLQSAIVAAALRLDAAVRSSTADDALIEEIQAEISDQINVLGVRAEQPLDFGRFILELGAVWSRVADVEVVADPAARDALDADPITRAITMEICGEVVSNAIRHGGATYVNVQLQLPQPHELLLDVSSDAATAPRHSEPGLGSRLLDECTLRWSERMTDDGRELTAWCPIGPSTFGGVYSEAHHAQQL